MPLITDKKKARNPKRTNKLPAITVSWGTWDRLDKLAEAEHVSLAKIVEALLDKYQGAANGNS